MEHAPERRLVSTRQRQLLELVRSRGAGHVEELARELGVSPSTVRRDLRQLSDEGALVRVHGGAAVPEDEPLPHVRATTHSTEKTRIGEAGAGLVEDYSTILLTGGTTTEAMVPFLSRRRGLTVLSNSIPVISGLANFEDIEVVVLGGLLRASEMSTLGSLTLEAVRDFNIDQVFFGCFGVDVGAGVTGSNVTEAQTDRGLLHDRERLVLLADSTKLGRRGPARVANLADVAVLVTDAAADAEIVARIAAAGVDVRTV